MQLTNTTHTTLILAILFAGLFVLVNNKTCLANSTTKSDSLINRLNEIEGKEKLKTLIQLTRHFQYNAPDSGNYYGLQALKLSLEINDTEEEINTLNALSNLKRNNGLYDSALYYANLGISVSGENGYDSELANFYYKKALIFEQQSNYDTALKYYKISLNLATRRQDTLPIINAHVDIGHLYYFWGENDSALFYFKNGLNLSEKSGYDLGIGRISVALGNIYYGWKKYEKAIEYYKKSYEIAQAIHNKYGIGISLSNIGAAYTDLKNPTEGIKYLQQAIPVLKEINDKDGLSNSYLSLGNCFMSNGEFDTAIVYLDKSLKIMEGHKNQENIAVAYYTYSEVYLKKGEYDKSLNYTKQALEIAREINFAHMIQACYKRLADIFQRTGSYQTSLQYWSRYDSIKDSIVSENTQKQMLDLETKYESEKHKKEIAILQKDNQIKELELRRREWQQNTTFAGLIIVILVVIALYSRYRINKKTTKILAEKNKQISEQNKSLAELNKSQQELIATKDKFFSIIAHDLKSPFNLIQGISDMFYEEFENLTKEEKKNFIKRISQSAEETFKLLENLLEWSYAQTGQLKINRENFDLSRIVSGTIAILEPQANRKKITIAFTELPESNAFADVNMVRTILRNLISNAIKFSYPDGKITIVLKPAGRFMEISVRDQGVGIDNKDQDNLFRIDNKIQTKGTANEKGTGLGLNLCHEFVNKNGGTISVQSTKGNGSSFIFTLPVSK